MESALGGVAAAAAAAHPALATPVLSPPSICIGRALDASVTADATPPLLVLGPSLIALELKIGAAAEVEDVTAGAAAVGCAWFIIV